MVGFRIEFEMCSGKLVKLIPEEKRSRSEKISRKIQFS